MMFRTTISAHGVLVARYPVHTGLHENLPAQILAFLAAPLTTLKTWQARAAYRANLRELDAHHLDDIGMTPAQAAIESRKPFWVA